MIEFQIFKYPLFIHSVDNFSKYTRTHASHTNNLHLHNTQIR